MENLKKTYGEFTYPPFKTQIDPDNETKQLQMFLPGYTVGSLKINSLDAREGQSEEPDDVSDGNKSQQSTVEDEHMEGYGKT